MSEYNEISAEELNEYVDSLEKENEALKAQVELLRTVISRTIAKWEGVKELEATLYVLMRFYNKTEEQCLAEIKAQAVADAVNAHPEKIAYIEHCGQTRSRGDYCDLWLSSSDLIQYANQLRQQAKGSDD